ncbi:MAG: hypothetical protein Kow00107_00840 [Planctomycetota bacterium]
MTETPPQPLYVEDVVEALQKSFSRVMARTAAVGSDSACAKLSGPVHFELDLLIEPQGDRLKVVEEGSVNLKFSGNIDLGVRYESQ